MNGTIVAAMLVGLVLNADAVAGARSDAQARFQSALTALHDFEYEDANAAFRQAQELDREFVLAYWGEALTYYQILWRQENVAAARQALARLGATPTARAAKASTPREQGLLSAVEVLFGDGDAAKRRGAYVQAMARLHSSFGDDPDISSLYALALIGSASRSLIGYSEGSQRAAAPLAGSPVQAQAAAILSDVLRAHPDHHGALHYLLHTYDDPEHARLALDAARRYAKVAAGASHALHMPAHIFLQLGLWHDAAAADRAAYDASVDSTRRRNAPITLRNFHALSWLQYELLQLGRYAEAARTLDDVAPAVSAANGQPSHGGHLPLLGDLSSMRARQVIEARQWNALGRQDTFGNVDELLAIGMSAAYTNNAALAELARRALQQRTQSEQEGDLRPAIRIMEREVAALIARAGGRRDEAIGIMQEAERTELALPAPFGLPSPPKPAAELLGELLLEAGRPQDAKVAFEHALRRNANRSLSVLGAARAAAAIGETAGARQRYAELLANYDRADSAVNEVAEARTVVARAAEERSAKASRSTEPVDSGARGFSRASSAAWITASATLLGLVALAIRRRKYARPKKKKADRRSR